jgi:hypothetical protein
VMLEKTALNANGKVQRTTRFKSLSALGKDADSIRTHRPSVLHLRLLLAAHNLPESFDACYE